jgi:hypothetical protein
MAEPPTRDDLVNELACLLGEGARLLLKKRDAEQQPEQTQPAEDASTPAISRNEVR